MAFCDVFVAARFSDSYDNGYDAGYDACVVSSGNVVEQWQ